MSNDFNQLIEACQWLKDTNGHYQERAVKTLVKLGDACAIEALCQALGHRYSDTRANAYGALVEIGAPAVEALCKKLALVESGVHDNTVEDYGFHNRTYGFEMTSIIPSFQSYAAKALVDIGASAVEPLCKTLGDKNRGVRKHAAEALGRIGDRDVLPRKILLSTKMTVQARVSALNSLSLKGEYYQNGQFHRYKTPDARQFCQEMAGNEGAEIRKAAEEMCRYLNNELVVPTKRDEPTEREQLLRAASDKAGSVSAENLLIGAEKPPLSAPKQSGLLGRFRWPGIRKHRKMDGADASDEIG